MNKEYYQIKSEEPVEVILNRLRDITIEQQPFKKPKSIYFIGKINNQLFTLITFNTPPVEFNFNVASEQVGFKYQKESISKLLKGVSYGIGIPVCFGLWIWSMLDKRVPIPGKIFLSLFLSVPFLLSKLSVSLYERFVLPSDHKIISDLEKRLNVRIEKYTN